MLVTLDVSPLDTLAAKFDVKPNILRMLVTLQVFQLDTSEVKCDAL